MNVWWDIEPDDTYATCINRVLESGDWQEPIAQYLADVIFKFGPEAGVTIGEAPMDGQLYGRERGQWEPITPPDLGGAVPEAPADGNLYGRIDFNWQIIPPPNQQGIPDAPIDGRLYGRENASWTQVPPNISDAPADGNPYARKNSGWTQIDDSGGVPEAPADGNLYGRKNDTWTVVPPPGTGPAGPQGPAGTNGSAATIAVRSTTTIAAGQQANVSNAGSPSDAQLDFYIPQGVAGVQGAIGPQGNTGATGPTGQGYTWRGAWSAATSYNAYDTVSYQGSSYVCTAANLNNPPSTSPSQWNLVAQMGTTGAQGTPGSAGATGPTGTAATIAVGNTTTGSPGSQATVTNTGSSSAAVLQFQIPAGVQGATGSTGATGPAGSTGATGPTGAQGSTGAAGTNGTNGLNAFNVTSGPFTVPPVGQTVNVTLGDASWIVLGQYVYVDGAAGIGVAGVLQVVGKTGNQISLLNPTTPPALPLADTTQNGLMRQVSGNTTDFVDGTNHTQNLVAALPIASATQKGLVNILSGNATDYIGGDNACHSIVAALLGVLVPTGSVLDFAGSTAPTGFLLCQGQTVSRTTYPALYAVIGTTWGAGDGSTTFGLPDLQGRTRIGAGQGTGLTNRALAGTGGEEAHTLLTTELAAHNHTASQGNHTHTDSGHAHYCANVDHLHSLQGHTHGYTSVTFGAGGYQLQAQSGGSQIGSAAANTGGPSVGTTASADRSLAFNTNNASAVISTVSAGAITIGNNGSGTGHNTMMPFAVLNAIIKT
jgi:microcystin-dependent protein